LDIPGELAFDSSGNLYVGNYNDTILKFSTNAVGSVFTTSGLNNPAGLAFDSSGDLYVVNAGNNRLEKFNSGGQGSVFTSTNLLSAPIGLAFDSSGNLYVANHGTGSILEFNSSGTGTVFASDLGNAIYLADEVPEPSSLFLLALGFSLLALVRHSLPASGGLVRHRLPASGGLVRHRLPASGGLGAGGFHRRRRHRIELQTR
jgi:sugar lactone lactonase YvrE